jgi:hypothetical protein
MSTKTEMLSSVWDMTFTKMVHDKLIPNVIDRVLLHGYSRSGKSTITGTLFENVQVATFQEGQLADELLGQYVTPEPGLFRWNDGPIAAAMRHGYPLVLNEIDYAFKRGSGLQGLIHACLDVPAAVTLPSGERLVAAPGYFVVATMNATPDSLPVPVFDRFQLILRVDTLSKGLQQYLGDYAGMANSVVGRGQEKVLWQRPMTVGLCYTAAKLSKSGLSPEEICNALGFSEPEKLDFLASLASNPGV